MPRSREASPVLQTRALLESISGGVYVFCYYFVTSALISVLPFLRIFDPVFDLFFSVSCSKVTEAATDRSLLTGNSELDIYFARGSPICSPDMVYKRYYPLGYPIYVVIRSIRKGKLSSKLLHKAYELVFIRKK